MKMQRCSWISIGYEGTSTMNVMVLPSAADTALSFIEMKPIAAAANVRRGRAQELAE